MTQGAEERPRLPLTSARGFVAEADRDIRHDELRLLGEPQNVPELERKDSRKAVVIKVKPRRNPSCTASVNPEYVRRLGLSPFSCWHGRCS